MIWNKTTLADISSKIQYGYTASAIEEAENLPKFLRITDIVPAHIDWKSVPFCEVGEDDFEKYKLEIGDIVIARTGNTTGFAKLIREDNNAVFASYLIRVKIDETKADANFVGQLIESNIYKRFVNSQKGGAAQGNANAKTLTLFTLTLPPIETQKRIAEILSAYDDLIENNLKRIRLLEESARLLYREWFVRLKFPNHEHTPLIDGLPEGWERLPVPEFIEVNPRTPIDKDKENCFIEMANLSNDSMLVSSLQRKKGNSGSKFQKGDTLFARITPCLENGKTGFVNFLEDGEVGFGSTEFIVLRAKSVPPEFVYCLSRTYHFRENAIKNMVGSSGRQRVKTSCFDEFFVGIPPKKILDEFESITKPCFRQIRNLQLQNQKLKQARDLLLPRLMSGEIAV